MSESKMLYSVEETLRIQTVKLNQQLNKLLEQNTQIIELTAECDNALAQNAELVAQVEKMRSALELAFISVKTCYKQDLAPYSDVVQVEKAIKLSPKNNLRDRDAEVGRAGFVACLNLANSAGLEWVTYHDADQYAEKVRRGEV
jgi:myosin heavy subunit